MAAATQIFGHSLFLLRAVPAIFAAAGVYTTCLLVAEFGGGVFAQLLASVVSLFTGVLSSFGGKVGPDEVGLWTWPLIALLVVRLSKGANPRLWIAAGVAAGITIESKYSVLFFLSAIIAGVLITSARRIVLNRWFAIGCAIATLIALPNFLWQWHYSFPMLELLRNGQTGKNIIVSPLLFLAQEIIITTPFLSPVWVIGLIWLLRGQQFRFLGFAYLILIVEMIAFHGKHYYPANVYPILIAAGATASEAWTQRLQVVRTAVVAYAVVLGLAFLPFSLPILPEDIFVKYEAKVASFLLIPRSALATEYNRETSALPGDWADMHGWPELAATVKRVYDELPPQERSQAVVLGDNYGGASAVEFFAPSVPVISAHNQYWLWGTKGYSGNVLVQMDGSCFKTDHLYASRTVVATFHSRWAISSERNMPIAICRGMRKPLTKEWLVAKAYE